MDPIIKTSCLSQHVENLGDEGQFWLFSAHKMRRREWYLCMRGGAHAKIVVEQRGPFWGEVTWVEPGQGLLNDIFGVQCPKYAKPPQFWSKNGLTEYWRSRLPATVDGLFDVHLHFEVLRDMYRQLAPGFLALTNQYGHSEQKFGQVRGEIRRLLNDGSITASQYTKELKRLRTQKPCLPPNEQISTFFWQEIHEKLRLRLSRPLLCSLIRLLETT